MAKELLSQAELETLLSSLEADAALAAASAPRVASPAQHATVATAPEPSERATAYDFRRPDRVGKESLRTLEIIHDAVSRNVMGALSTLVRNPVEVKLRSVDPLPFRDFLFGLETPSCIQLVRAAPLAGHWILEFSPSIFYPLIDRLLGGGREPSAVANRPLTEIELRLVSHIARPFLQELTAAWRNLLELKLAVERVESDPQLVQIVAANEVVVSITFELGVGTSSGLVRLCVPYHALQPLDGKLSHPNWTEAGRHEPTRASIEQIGQNLQHSVVEVVARLAETKISTGDVLGLRVGDIITTEKDQHSPVAVCVEGVEKFRAQPGQLKGRKAIRIEESGSRPGDRK